MARKPGETRGRKPGSRTKMQMMTDEEAREKLAQRMKALENSPAGLSNMQKRDRDYFMSAFKVMTDYFDSRIDKNSPKGHENRRFTPLEMYERCKQFLALTIMAAQPITFSGMAYFMGMRRKELFQMFNEPGLPSSYDFIQDFSALAEMYNEYAAHKKQNPAGPIFILKNLGWKDKIELEATSTMGALTDVEREVAQQRIQNFSE